MAQPPRAANVLLATYLAETRLARALNAKTPVTRAVIGVLVLAHLALSVTIESVQRGSGLEEARFSDILVFAALIPSEVESGALWRMVSGQLAHADILHLAFNLLTFGIVAPLAERLYGSVRFIILLGGAALCAALAVVAFSDGPTVGASALIFGVLGSFVAFAIKEKRRLPSALSRTLLRQAVVVLVFGAVVGFFVPSFNNLAHFGGAVGGIAAGWSLAPAATRDGRLSGLADAFATTVAALALFGAVMTAAEVQRCGGSEGRLLGCYPDYVLAEDAAEEGAEGDEEAGNAETEESGEGSVSEREGSE